MPRRKKHKHRLQHIPIDYFVERVTFRYILLPPIITEISHVPPQIEIIVPVVVGWEFLGRLSGLDLNLVVLRISQVRNYVSVTGDVLTYRIRLF